MLIAESTQLKERMEVLDSVEGEFMDLKEIMNRQEIQIGEKKGNIDELVEVVERMKGLLANYQEEIEGLKREKNRLIGNVQQVENRWKGKTREMQEEFEERERRMKEEQDKLKEVVRHLNQISNLTKNMTI